MLAGMAPRAQLRSPLVRSGVWRRRIAYASLCATALVLLIPVTAYYAHTTKVLLTVRLTSSTELSYGHIYWPCRNSGFGDTTTALWLTRNGWSTQFVVFDGKLPDRVELRATTSMRRAWLVGYVAAGSRNVVGALDIDRCVYTDLNGFVTHGCHALPSFVPASTEWQHMPAWAKTSGGVLLGKAD